MSKLGISTVCIQCQKHFLSKRKNTLFCSNICRAAHHRSKEVIVAERNIPTGHAGGKECPICGKDVKARGMGGHIRLIHQSQASFINKVWDSPVPITHKSLDDELERAMIVLMDLRLKIKCNGLTP